MSEQQTETINDERLNKIIEQIKSVTPANFSFSRKYIGVDEFTNIKYYEDDIVQYQFELAINLGYTFPYAALWCHMKNGWKFELSSIQFMIERNFIPFSYMEFPEAFMVPRSDGSINGGRMNTSEYNAMTIRQSKSNPENGKNILIPVTFYDENMDENMVKHVSLESVLMKNPTIIKLSFNFPKINRKVEEVSFDYDMSEQVYEHFQKVYQEWIDNTIQPIIKKIRERTHVEISANISS
jgi:hypothetical protein